MNTQAAKNPCCVECGGELVIKGYTHTEQVGRATITDKTTMVPVCSRCDEPSLSLADLAAFERRAAAVVLRDGRYVDGEVIKYARKALGLKQAALADVLQCSPETLSRWENDAKPMQRAEQLALVALLEGAERGLSVAPPAPAEPSNKTPALEVPARKAG